MSASDIDPGKLTFGYRRTIALERAVPPQPGNRSDLVKPFPTSRLVGRCFGSSLLNLGVCSTTHRLRNRICSQWLHLRIAGAGGVRRHC
jgi:hypothetical protein